MIPLRDLVSGGLRIPFSGLAHLFTAVPLYVIFTVERIAVFTFPTVRILGGE
jgi:hypothetical protein